MRFPQKAATALVFILAAPIALIAHDLTEPPTLKEFGEAFVNAVMRSLTFYGILLAEAAPIIILGVGLLAFFGLWNLIEKIVDLIKSRRKKT